MTSKKEGLEGLFRSSDETFRGNYTGVFKAKNLIYRVFATGRRLVTLELNNTEGFGDP
jgi:hypothetical protein